MTGPPYSLPWRNMLPCAVKAPKGYRLRLLPLLPWVDVEYPEALTIPELYDMHMGLYPGTSNPKQAYRFADHYVRYIAATVRVVGHFRVLKHGKTWQQDETHCDPKFKMSYEQ